MNSRTDEFHNVLDILIQQGTVDIGLLHATIVMFDSRLRTLEEHLRLGTGEIAPALIAALRIGQEMPAVREERAAADTPAAIGSDEESAGASFPVPEPAFHPSSMYANPAAASS